MEWYIWKCYLHIIDINKWTVAIASNRHLCLYMLLCVTSVHASLPSRQTNSRFWFIRSYQFREIRIPCKMILKSESCVSMFRARWHWIRVTLEQTGVAGSQQSCRGCWQEDLTSAKHSLLAGNMLLVVSRLNKSNTKSSLSSPPKTPFQSGFLHSKARWYIKPHFVCGYGSQCEKDWSV